MPAARTAPRLHGEVRGSGVRPCTAFRRRARAGIATPKEDMDIEPSSKTASKSVEGIPAQRVACDNGRGRRWACPARTRQRHQARSTRTGTLPLNWWPASIARRAAPHPRTPGRTGNTPYPAFRIEHPRPAPPGQQGFPPTCRGAPADGRGSRPRPHCMECSSRQERC